jgi:hypothetical protein
MENFSTVEMAEFGSLAASNNDSIPSGRFEEFWGSGIIRNEQ